MSHTIDFQCHQTASVWNGHWTYSDFVWKLIRGRRPYLINRLPHSRHLALMHGAGFAVINDVKYRLPSTLARGDLAPRFDGMDADDLVTSGAFVQAAKPRAVRTGAA
jgi:hypothetical protein